MGTSDFAQAILDGLISAQYNVVAVYTQPDKKVGRDQEVRKSSVKLLAEEKKIPVLQPERFDEKTINELREIKPDLVVVAAYGKILPKETLDIPGFKCLNVHASLLPKFRGPSPIQNAILHGEKETGITIMLMDEGIDTGKIISQKKIGINKNDTSEDLFESLAALGKQLLLDTIPSWIEGKIKPKAQNNDEATLCQLIERQDGKINWTDDAQSIYDRYRALYPWPGVYTFWKKNAGSSHSLRLKISKMSLEEKGSMKDGHVGQVIKEGEKIGVLTDSGIIVLEEIQLEGKSKTDIRQFINGYPDFLGSILI